MGNLFIVMGLIGLVVAVCCYIAAYENSSPKGQTLRACSGFGGFLALSVFVVGLNTAQGQFLVARFLAGGSHGTWLVIDCSGGKTMRHWVLESGYVQSSEQSDGWQFLDSKGNICYVSGDAYIMKVETPLNTFLADYKSIYNIPQEQVAIK